MRQHEYPQLVCCIIWNSSTHTQTPHSICSNKQNSTVEQSVNEESGNKKWTQLLFMNSHVEFIIFSVTSAVFSLPRDQWIFCWTMPRFYWTVCARLLACCVQTYMNEVKKIFAYFTFRTHLFELIRYWIHCLAMFRNYTHRHLCIEITRLIMASGACNVPLHQPENMQDMIFNAKLTIIQEQTSRNGWNSFFLLNEKTEWFF